MKNIKLFNILLVIMACLLWSTAYAGIKTGYLYMDKKYAFAGLRFTLAGLMLIPISWNKKE